VYGENGVSALIPQGNVWGLQAVHSLGLKGKHAVAGTESAHYFIDREGDLFGLSDGLQRMGYAEYLNGLTSPVMSRDNESGLIYICDGAQGFVYNPDDQSLGEGPKNITGLHAQGGTLYIVSPATITTDAFEICTDILDMGTRKAKTLRSVDFGTDVAQSLTACIDYRRNKASDWSQTEWRTVGANGKCFITCFGNEFRVRAKAAAYEYLELDYLTLNGTIHDY
jgi:hypothetical protein